MRRNSFVVFNNVSKSFLLGRENRLKKKLTQLNNDNKNKIEVLNRISFRVDKKGIIGFYGPNGCGKTTILKLISGVFKPDSGKIKVKGRVASVIELGAGLHPELTGYDNVYLYGSIMGLGRKHIDNILDNVIAFSGLDRFIGFPIKKYSSGMKARLAFSTAIFSNPDVLLLDEVLSVGDYDFRIKCENLLNKMKKEMIIILTSHELPLLLSICDRIIAFDSGQLSLINGRDSIKVFKLHNYPTKDKPVNFTAISSEMEPSIMKGDVLTISKFKFGLLREGNIVAFRSENLTFFLIRRIIGKVISEKKINFISKGDSTGVIDPWLINESNYVGKVEI